MPKAKPRAGEQAPLIRLFQHLRPYQRRVWWAASCSVINKIFDLAPPVLIALAVDVVVQQDTSWLARLGATTVSSQLIVLAALTFLVWTAESFFEYLYGVNVPEMELSIDKRAGRMFGPPATKKLIYFIDDMNLPYIETYGTQNSIALITQLMQQNDSQQ